MAEVWKGPGDVQSDSVILSVTGQLDPWLARKVLEGAPTIVYVYDIKAERSLFQNRKLAELLGHPPSETPQQETEWQRFVHPDDAATFPEHRARLKRIRPGETLSWQFRLRHADGNWRHFVSRDVLLSPDAQGEPWLIVGNTTDMTEQKIAEERKTIVLTEMRHRARNFTSVIEGIGRQSLPRDNPAVKQFFQTLMGRLRALLDAGDIVLASESRMADMRTVAQMTTAPFATSITADGPSIELPEMKAAGIALALHELATNAVKYGALSGSGGSVSLNWHVDQDREGHRSLIVEWKEHCLKPIAPPQQEGFGTRLIRYAAPQSTDGKVDLVYEPDGVRCRMQLVLP